MKRVLFDTNVLLDVVLGRAPHVKAAEEVWGLIEGRLAEGYIAAHTVTTFYYMLRKQRDSIQARFAIQSLIRVFKVALVDDQVIEEAMRASGSDFEDCVTAAAARRAGCELIVTRDPRGFRSSPVKTVAPASALSLLRR
jgi:predicted nucleic acid-binding protein